MQTIKVSAQSRNESGKGAVRRIRAKGQIPAVAYGPRLESTALAISPKDVLSVLGTEYGPNTVIDLDIDGSKKLTVLLADFQYHPVTRELLHADFFEIKPDEPIDLDIPFEATGKAKGVVEGGLLRQVFRKLPVRCLPSVVPVKITHDVTEVELDGSVAASQLSLPPGVSVRLPPEQTVLHVARVKKQVEEAAVPGAPGAVATAGAAGAGAAPPAAGGKAAAAAPAAAGKAPAKK